MDGPSSFPSSRVPSLSIDPGAGDALRRGGSACDACRRRKLKCSGAQPCERCLSTGVNCTYGLSASRSDAQSYIRHLEAKVGELQHLLQQQAPTGKDEALVRDTRSRVREDVVETIVSAEDSGIYLESNEEDRTFYGRLSGLGVLGSISELCNQVAGAQNNQYGKSIAEAFDSNSLGVPANNAIASLALLPSREVAKATIRVALDEALSCQECIDRDTLRHQVERLYTTDPEDYEARDRRALSLVYALLALGRQRRTPGALSDDTPWAKDMQGISYFRASQATFDATSCNHLESIRTTICLVNFLLAASMVSKAYNFLCIGVGAALRMGLHVYSASTREQFTVDELSQRRQVFAVLYHTQAYLASVLGMPLILKDADPEQMIALPEEDLHDDGKSLTTRHPYSPLSNTIRLGKLFRISADITESRSVWPRNELGQKDAHAFNQVKITQWEQLLSQWRQELPQLPSEQPDRNIVRTQLMLRFVEAAITVTIYRPFMQHVIRTRADSDFSEKGLEYSFACIQASIRAVHVAQLMEEHSVLDAAQWYVTYNLAIAASSLRLVMLSKQDETFIDVARASEHTAQELLKTLGRTSVSARKCSESLDVLQAAVETLAMSPRSRFMQAVGAS